MFSKYDVYTTVQSLYCYPDSDVLKNKLNIRDRNELKQAEEEITSQTVYAHGITYQGQVHQDTAYKYPPLSVRGYLSVCRTYPP